jgi:pyruvate formate lyase activating enzyme
MLGQDMSVSDVMSVVLRDRLFYDSSRGGVTFSGGEPLLQSAFLRELLLAAREQFLHTALDTCGFTELATLLEMAPLVDLFLYDIKCMDDQQHLAHTGVSNRKILDNLQALAGIHDNIWVRIPLIPGFNDTAPLLKAAANFVAALPAVRQVNLLPYHRLGTSKAKGGQSEQAMLYEKQITQEQLEEASGLFQAAGLTTLIGG